MGKLLSIVINSNHMRIAELTLSKKGVTVSRLLTKDVPDSFVEGGVIRNVREFADFLTLTLRIANITTKRVVFSMPTDKIMTREILLPELSREKLKTTIKANASEYFPIDLEDYVLSYFTIAKVYQHDEEKSADYDREKNSGNKKKKTAGKSRNSKTQLRLMVVAAPNDMVQSYYDVAGLVRLKLEAVDYIGNSAFQLTADQIGEEPCLVIQLDREHTELTIYDNNVMVLQRHIDFGSTVIIAAAAEQECCSLEEAEGLLETGGLIHSNFDDGDLTTDSLCYLVSNIKRVVEYYTGRNSEHPLELVYVMGDGSVTPGLDQLLYNQLDLPVEVISALKQVYVKGEAGFSMKEVLKYTDNIGAVLGPIDFIPKKLEQDTRRHLEQKIYHIMILIVLFTALIIVTIPATKFFGITAEVMELKNKLEVMEDTVPVLEKYRQASARYEDVRKAQSYTKTNNRDLREFIDVFEQLMPSNVSITDFACNNGEISISALADGKQTVAKLIQQLDIMANVSEVKVSNLSSIFVGDAETVSFSLTCKLTSKDSAFTTEVAEDEIPVEKVGVYNEDDLQR